MNAPLVLGQLARLQDAVVLAEREHERHLKRVIASVPGAAYAEMQASDALSDAIVERDLMLNAIRHHELVQCHNALTCPLCEEVPSATS